VDSMEINAVMQALKSSRTPKKVLLDHRDDGKEYPEGSHPTWSHIKEVVQVNPLNIMRKWVLGPHLSADIVNKDASNLFIAFTWQTWMAVNIGHRLLRWKPTKTMTLEDAMRLWTPESIDSHIRSVQWIASLPPDAGVTGRPREAFGDRWTMYFPPQSPKPPQASVWSTFVERPGYIYRYHQYIASHTAEDVASLQRCLELIFTDLQCLPDSSRFSGANGVGRIWTHEQGQVKILTNPTYYRVAGYGEHTRKKRAPGPSAQSTKRQLLKDINDEEGISLADQKAAQKIARYRKKGRSAKAKNARKPPPGRKGNKTQPTPDVDRNADEVDDRASAGPVDISQEYGAQSALDAEERLSRDSEIRLGNDGAEMDELSDIEEFAQFIQGLQPAAARADDDEDDVSSVEDPDEESDVHVASSDSDEQPKSMLSTRKAAKRIRATQEPDDDWEDVNSDSVGSEQDSDATRDEYNSDSGSNGYGSGEE
jgi:hypothetical protein